MVRDITFENCCFKIEFYETVCQDMINSAGALTGVSGGLVKCWHHTIFIHEI